MSRSIALLCLVAVACGDDGLVTGRRDASTGTDAFVSPGVDGFTPAVDASIDLGTPVDAASTPDLGRDLGPEPDPCANQCYLTAAGRATNLPTSTCATTGAYHQGTEPTPPITCWRCATPTNAGDTMAAGWYGGGTFATCDGSVETAPPPRTWTQPFGPMSWMIGFDIYNPGVSGTTSSSCFGSRPLSELKHAGEDWAGTTGTTVQAIGEGVVRYATNVGYPGWVVVVEHTLTAAEQSATGLGPTLYSQYGHLSSSLVSVGANVEAGTPLGTLYAWGSNTHLHWEVRTEAQPLHGLCTGTRTWHGPGYTPNGTNATDFGYLAPSVTVEALIAAR